MTNRELIEKYRRQVHEGIQRQKLIIAELEQIEEKIAELTQMEYRWDEEVDLSLETFHSPDDDIFDRSNWRPRPYRDAVIYVFLLLFMAASVLLLIIYYRQGA